MTEYFAVFPPAGTAKTRFAVAVPFGIGTRRMNGPLADEIADAAVSGRLTPIRYTSGPTCPLYGVALSASFPVLSARRKFVPTSTASTGTVSSMPPATRIFPPRAP